MMIVQPARLSSAPVAPGPYRYLKLTWPAYGSSGNLGLNDVRYYVGSTAYPPDMTSNTAPAPYVVSASSVVNSTYLEYKAFDAAALSTSEFVQNGVGAGWLKLDFGAGHGISPSSLTLRPRSSFPAETPSGLLTLSGSNDDMTYITLATFTPAAWVSGVTQTFSTGIPGAYV